MIPAKKILNTISENWTVLELLFKQFKTSDFTIKNLQIAIKIKNPDWQSERIYKESNKLLTQEIIIPLAKSSQLEINPAVADFAGFLLHEEDIGLAGEITVLIEDLERLGSKLQMCGIDGDFYGLKRYLRIMDERVRKIVKLFKHNEGAILNIVENAKSDDSNVSLKKRYQAVMDAFDEYIEPMLEMVNINGPFYRCFITIEDQISEQIQAIEIYGRAQNEKKALEQLRTRILDMHLVGKVSLTTSADMLMPLREELRKNNLITRQASRVLSQIRKNGVNHVLANAYPHFISETLKFSIGQQRHIMAYMASLSNFEHEVYTLPNNTHITEYQHPHIPDYKSVLTAFKENSGTNPDIIKFLTEKYPKLDAEELIFLYQKIINEPSFEVVQNKQNLHIEIANTWFDLYPYTAKTRSST